MEVMFKRVGCPGEGVTGLGSELLCSGWSLVQVGVPGVVYDGIVPGNVRQSLVRAGAIPDPLLGTNNEQSKWVPEVEWEYRREVDQSPWFDPILDNLGGSGVVHLAFDAVDYDASFLVNGTRVCRQVGMFSTVDLARGVSHEDAGVGGGDVDLRVRFHIQPWWRTHAVKCQMAFGWDFAPELRTLGIWKPVRGYYTGPAFFTGVQVLARPPPSPGTGNSRVVVRGTVKVVDPATMSDLPGVHAVDLHVEVGDLDRVVTVEARSGVPFAVDAGEAHVPRWEPWSLGSPALVLARVGLLWGGALSDEYRGVAVNRRVRWLRNPGTPRGHENWTLEVNGKRMFARGINWVPPDALFGRVDADKYRALVDAALDMNVDVLRVWGGGVEEKSEFYDYCDEVGMMVWQEFPFACTNYPRDPKYLAIVRRECEGIVARTRRHPSVVVYCGGNEFNPFINAHVVSIVREAVAKYAPGVHCFVASPFGGDDHNWRVWGERRDFDAYDVDGSGPRGNSFFQMLTEFGVQAAPDSRTLAACYSGSTGVSTGGSTGGPTSTAPLGDRGAGEIQVSEVAEALGYHKADLAGLQEYARRFGREVGDLASLVKVSQEVQAHALKYAVEVCRSSWPNVSGVFPWQLSDPWPNVSWSVVDYYLRPKLGARVLKAAYSPVLPMVRRWRKSPRGSGWKRGNVVVHNSTQREFTGILSLEVVPPGGGGAGGPPTKVVELRLKVSPGRPLLATTVDAKDQAGSVVRLRLRDVDGREVAKNSS
ncbi:MAG: glycosyl hydrolase 2 galactose-binding domain-containing protein, partial [Promethearchaeota archaeon]